MREAARSFLGGSRNDPKILYADGGHRRAEVGRGPGRRNGRVVGFLSGGDGVRMKAMLDEFAGARRQGQDRRDDFGMGHALLRPQGADRRRDRAGSGDHDLPSTSRMPLGVSEGVLSELKPEETGRRRDKASDFSPANWKAAQGPDGKQYAVPLDIHSIILFYNKDLLKKAGLLGDDGKPKNSTALTISTRRSPNEREWGHRAFRSERRRFGLAYFLHPAQPAGRRVPEGRQVPRRRNLDKAAKALAEMQSWTKNGWGRQRTPNIRRRSRSSRRVRRRCISTASGKCRRWSTSPRRASCSTRRDPDSVL